MGLNTSSVLALILYDNIVIFIMVYALSQLGFNHNVSAYTANAPCCHIWLLFGLCTIRNLQGEHASLHQEKASELSAKYCHYLLQGLDLVLRKDRIINTSIHIIVRSRLHLLKMANPCKRQNIPFLSYRHKYRDIINIIIYIRLFGEAINLCI